MSAQKILAAILILSIMLFLVSCTKSPKSSESDKAKVSSSVASSSEQEAKTFDTTPILQDDKSLIFNEDIEEQAKQYSTTPAIIALAMLICKLDDSQDYYELIKYDAKELFARLREAAISKNVTLETLDENYDLSVILGCEQIYVEFSSNNVTPRKDVDKDDYINDWVCKFHMSIMEKGIVDN